MEPVTETKAMCNLPSSKYPTTVRSHSTVYLGVSVSTHRQATTSLFTAKLTEKFRRNFSHFAHLMISVATLSIFLCLSLVFSIVPTHMSRALSHAMPALRGLHLVFATLCRSYLALSGIFNIPCRHVHLVVSPRLPWVLLRLATMT